MDKKDVIKLMWELDKYPERLNYKIQILEAQRNRNAVEGMVNFDFSQIGHSDTKHDKKTGRFIKGDKVRKPPICRNCGKTKPTLIVFSDGKVGIECVYCKQLSEIPPPAKAGGFLSVA